MHSKTDIPLGLYLHPRRQLLLVFEAQPAEPPTPLPVVQLDRPSKHLANRSPGWISP